MSTSVDPIRKLDELKAEIKASNAKIERLEKLLYVVIALQIIQLFVD